MGWGGGWTAGLEINFLRQAPKSVNNTNQNLWSPIFLLRIRTKRAPLGPQRRFFRQKIRLHANINTLIIYTPTNTENPRLRNRMPTIMIYTVLCDCQIFKVNFVPSLISTFWRRNVPDGKTAVWFFTLSKTIFLSRSVKEIEGSPCFSHQATTVQHLSFQCQNLCQMQR